MEQNQENSQNLRELNEQNTNDKEVKKEQKLNEKSNNTDDKKLSKEQEINYLSAFKTEKEMKAAMKLIRNTCNTYYKTNTLEFHKFGYDLDDLEIIVHEHLLFKFGNTGFRVTSMANLKHMAKMSMNAILRDIKLKYGNDKITDEERNDKSINIIRKEVIKVSSLTEMTDIYHQSSESGNTTTLEDAILSDNGIQEEQCLAKLKLDTFCEALRDENPEYELLFKINTYLNIGENLINNDYYERKIFDMFKDLIIKRIDGDFITSKNENALNNSTTLEEYLNEINKIAIKNSNMSKSKSNSNNIKSIMNRIHNDKLKRQRDIEFGTLKIEDLHKRKFKKPNIDNTKMTYKIKKQKTVAKQKSNAIYINKKDISFKDIIDRLGLHITEKEYKKVYMDTCNRLADLLEIKPMTKEDMKNLGKVKKNKNKKQLVTQV